MKIMWTHSLRSNLKFKSNIKLSPRKTLKSVSKRKIPSNPSQEAKKLKRTPECLNLKTLISEMNKKSLSIKRNPSNLTKTTTKDPVILNIPPPPTTTLNTPSTETTNPPKTETLLSDSIPLTTSPTLPTTPSSITPTSIMLIKTVQSPTKMPPTTSNNSKRRMCFQALETLAWETWVLWQI